MRADLQKGTANTFTALQHIPSLDFSALDGGKWADRLRMENTCSRFLISGNRMTVRRNTDLKSPRPAYAVNQYVV